MDNESLQALCHSIREQKHGTMGKFTAIEIIQDVPDIDYEQ